MNRRAVPAPQRRAQRSSARARQYPCPAVPVPSGAVPGTSVSSNAVPIYEVPSNAVPAQRPQQSGAQRSGAQRSGARAAANPQRRAGSNTQSITSQTGVYPIRR
jgi:hypothetical protein